MRSTHTQLAGYDSVTDTKRCTQKQMITNLFYSEHLTLTRQEIADRTNLRLSSVCGRVRELLDNEALKVRGSQKCPATGVLNETIGLPSAN
jgi:DNA-binding transcriptional regulator LsrR (DeoR family)